MKKFTLHLNKLKYLGMFVLLFVISSCEKDFIPNEEKNSNRSELFLNPMTSLLHKGDAKEQFENLKKHLSNSGVAAKPMGDSISFDWGRVLDEPVLQVTTSNGVRNTTFKVEVHEPHPNRFVNLVVTEEGDSLLSISLYGYMMDNDFAEAYHYNGVSIDKFSGAVLKFPITDTGSPCPPPVPIITTVEPDEDYTGGGQSYYVPGFPQTGASGFMGGFAGVYSSSYGTSSPLEYPETGNNSGGSWGVDIGGVVGNIGDVLGDIGEAIGDFFGGIASWIGSLFSGDDCNGCATNNRPLGGFEGNSPNLYSGYLMYTPPLIENCEKPSVVGILEMHYSNESIAAYLGISINDWLFLTMVQNAEFFREAMNFLEVHGFSHASLDFFHQVLADYRDDQNLDFTMMFFEFSLTPEQMGWWNDSDNAAERAEIKMFLEEDGFLKGRFDLVEEIINAGIDGTLISAFPFFKYPNGSNYATLYPITTSYLADQIPKCANNQNIVQEIITLTGLTETEIKSDLQWGKGPVIDIIQLDNYTGSLGICTSCNDLTAGLTDSNISDKTFIDIDMVNLIESDNLNTNDSNMLQLFFVTAILHEYVHLGANLNNINFPGEIGSAFEVRVWGVTHGNNLRKFYSALIRK